MEWFIADTHFRHKNILEFENRPYLTIEDMERYMIESWNDVVGKNDTVYVVGDFCFGKEKAWIEILEQLKGNIILIKGNHDHHKVIKKVLDAGYLKNVYDVGTMIRLDKIELLLSHFPIDLGERPNRFNISGHIHSEESKHLDQINVGVDSDFMNNYRIMNSVSFGSPVPLTYIEEHVKKVNSRLMELYKRGN